MKSSLYSLIKLGAILLIGWMGFSYAGPNGALLHAITTMLLAGIVASSVLGQHVREKHAPPAHTELVVEMYGGRLLRHSAYGSLGEVVIDELERRREALAVLRQKYEENWVFVFFGSPGTGDTIVWSAKHKVMSSDETLIYERLWDEVLKGRPEAQDEPYLVLELAEKQRRYRMQLDWTIAKGDGAKGRKAQTLCMFPLVLLEVRPSPTLCEEACRDCGLRVVPNESDYYEDDDGECHLTWSHVRPYRVYENDLFRFKVRHHWGGA